MKKVFWCLMFLAWVLPGVLHAAVDEGLEEFKMKLAQDPNLTDAQRDTLLAKRMKQLEAGTARPDRKAARSQKPVKNKSGRPKAGSSKTAQPRNILVR